MGKPHRVNLDDSAQAESILGEVKHLSTQRKINKLDTVSSGEEKPVQPKPTCLTCVQQQLSITNFFNDRV